MNLPLKSTDSESVQEEESSCTRFPTNVRQRKVAKKKQKEIPSSSLSSTIRESKPEEKGFDKMGVLGLKILGVAATAIVFSPIPAMLLADFLIFDSMLRDGDSSDVDDAQKRKKE